MLDLIRNHKRLMLLILVLLVFPSFVFLGVQGYSSMSSGVAGQVAQVDGVPITIGQLNDRLRIIQRNNPDVSVQELESPKFKLEYLGSMVQELLWNMASQNNRLLITDKALRDAMKLNPDIRALMDAQGNMDMQRYESLLRYNGLQPHQFENMERLRVMGERMQLPVSNGFSSQIEVDQAMHMLGDKYILRQQTFNLQDFISQVDLNEQDIQQYYQDNQMLFMAPAHVDIEYVIYDAQTVGKTIDIAVDDIRSYYDQNKEALATPEQRRVSHILIAWDPQATQEQKTQAYEKALKLLADVKQDPSSFADVAKANSDDPGSAAKGGDLDFYTNGNMVEAFDQAVFSQTQEGVIDEVIETPFGYHIIMLTGIRPSVIPSFEELQPKLEAQLREELALQQFAKNAEMFSDDVYRNSLQDVATQYGLTIEHAEKVTMSPQADAYGVLASPLFISAMFAPEVRDGQQNIQAVQLSPTQLASGRVVSYTPSTVKPFEQVENEVKLLATQNKAFELAQAAGQELLNVWQENPETANSAKEIITSRLTYNLSVQGQDVPEIAPEAAAKVFRLSSGFQLPQSIGVSTSDMGYIVVQVQKVEPVDLTNKELRDQVLLFANQVTTQAQGQAYLDYMIEKYNVKFYPEALIPQQNMPNP